MKQIKSLLKSAITAFGTIGLGIIGLGLGTQAVQLSDGTVYFENPPRLIDSAIREQSVLANNAKYYFELTVPNNAGEPLERIELAQQNGNLFTREINFDLEDSRAFIGHRRNNRDGELTLGYVGFDEETNTVAITFDPPVSPGTDFTIQMNAKRNPRRGGIYLFGVTAYPEGDSAYGQFLGFGRFHIFDTRDRDFF